MNVSATAGGPFKNPIAARGAAFGDLNNDGQLDIVVGVLDSGPLVLRNNGTRNHWLGVLLTGSQSNRQGLGARVTVADNSGKKQFFEVTTAGSYISAQGVTEITALAHFGQTPQAFANCSPGLKHSDNPGIRLPILFNPERVRLHKPFQGSGLLFVSIPRVVAALQPWAAISERLRRNSQNWTRRNSQN